MSKPKKNKLNRQAFKKEGEELQQYLHLRKRGFTKKNGKAYDRKKFKKGED